MSVDIRRHGKYMLYDTTQRYRMLNLDDRDFYVWRQTPLGTMLELSDPGHEASEIMHRGDYVMVVAYNEKDLEDGVPYLFLQEDQQYEAYRLPDSLPTEDSNIRPIEPMKRLYNRDYLAGILGGVL